VALLDPAGTIAALATTVSVGSFRVETVGRDWPFGQTVKSQAPLTMDSAGNLYGTTCADGTNHYGNVFRLSPVSVGWTYTDLHDFSGGTDGGNPISNAVCDSAGNLYGTASAGGTDGYGVV
jgi:hypothetical protein